MDSRWDDAEAQRFIDRYAPTWGERLALRTYSSRLIGAEPALVLHGGGNTSVKDAREDLLGDRVEAVCVKGSGWDLASIEPQGFPAVRLAPMRRLVQRDALTDEHMVAAQRANLLDPSSPNPSIECLLHAFLPARFVDHSHADAIVALTNHPDGADLVREALGDDVLLVPYVKPGFDLARDAARAFAAQPGAQAMVLLQHGLFTWGETARDSYERHLALVTAAERFLAGRGAVVTVARSGADVDAARSRAGRIAPVLRGALRRHGPPGASVVLHHAVDAELLSLVDDPRLPGWASTGPLTPDHGIRTKPRACAVALPDRPDEAAAIEAAVAAYVRDYTAYVDAQVARVGEVTRLDPTPRVIHVPGVGVFGVGDSPKAAAICTDIARHTLRTKRAAEAIGPFEALPDSDLFDVEYWSLEQAKLRKGGAPGPFAARVALVTGAGGAIGAGIARVLREAGCCVVLSDIDGDRLAAAVRALGAGRDLATVVMDVTDPASVAAGFDVACRAFGGLDVVVANAGIAAVGPLASLDADTFRRVQEVNTTGTFLTVQAGARALRAQGAGGSIVVVGSKNVAGPGADFGAYSASKAGAHQIARVAALELAADGIRVNVVAPDAVFADEAGGALSSGLWEAVGPSRAASKGLDPAALAAHYRDRNLLRAEVTGRHVGEAVRFLASGVAPITGAVLPVDGGVAAAFVR